MDRKGFDVILNMLAIGMPTSVQPPKLNVSKFLQLNENIWYFICNNILIGNFYISLPSIRLVEIFIWVLQQQFKSAAVMLDIAVLV
jgi:hypothetical protein